MQKDNTDNSNSYCIPTGFKCIDYTDSNKVTTEFTVTENRKVTVYTIPLLLNKETGLFEEMEIYALYCK